MQGVLGISRLKTPTTKRRKPQESFLLCRPTMRPCFATTVIVPVPPFSVSRWCQQDGWLDKFPIIKETSKIWSILCNVLQTARQRTAQFVQRFRFNIVIGPQAADSLAVYAASLPQLVSGDSSIFHGDPEPFKYNHTAVPPS